MTALEKALAMIDAVLEYRHPVSLPDLTERLREGRGTVHRRLKQLEQEGLLLRDPRGHVTVGPRLSALGLATLRSRNQGEAVRGLLQEIVDDVKEACSIGVLDGFDYVVMELSECPLSLRMHMSVGSRAQAHCLAGGKIMLADLDVQSLRLLLRTNKLEARTAKTITSRAALETELATVRTRGFALNNQQSLPGVVAVAVPIWDADDRVVAALALHGPTSRLSLKACKALVPRLQRTAKRIARIWFPRRRNRPRK